MTPTTYASLASVLRHDMATAGRQTARLAAQIRRLAVPSPITIDFHEPSAHEGHGGCEGIARVQVGKQPGAIDMML
jgi:hypothetical protein